MNQPTVPSPTVLVSEEHSEGARAFLQSRVTLFWKVMFFIVLSSSAVGVVEVSIGKIPWGNAHLLNTISTVASGYIWWLCRRGTRSIRFSRFMEAEALILHSALGTFLIRYAASQFATQQSLDNLEASIMADGFFVAIAQGGSALLVVIRAALIPSLPWRTALVTAAYGVPLLIVPTVFTSLSNGDLIWRGLSPDVFPWLMGLSTMMWLYATITCTVISAVTYKLRKEVRRAQRLGQYTLERKIGEGGMGEVFEAHHGMMRRPSAIKLLRAGKDGEASVQRFEREVRMTASLTHPNTITIFDYGRTADGVFYYAMELLQGATLRQVVEASGAQKPERVIRILLMACGALNEAHRSGMIHRDIKPANIMLCTQGGELDIVKILDFGLVKNIKMNQDLQLTHADVVTGTPQNLPPEAILKPDSVDARSDIYALGTVAYYLLAGGELFTGDSIIEICGKHLHETPEPFSARGIHVPPDLEEIVFSCLNKKQSQRPQSVAELKGQLEACSVGIWSTENAQAWWSKHTPRLALLKESSSAGERTIAIANREHSM